MILLTLVTGGQRLTPVLGLLIAEAESFFGGRGRLRDVGAGK